MKLRDLDTMDQMLDEHFSNDTGIKSGVKQMGRSVPAEKRQRIGDAMRGQTLEELIGEERAAEGRKKRSEAHKGKKRPEEVVAKIASTRKATGSYDSPTHGMNGKTHKESTKEIQGQKARIRQELKRKLGLGKSDSVPKDLLEQEYKKQGLL